MQQQLQKVASESVSPMSPGRAAAVLALLLLVGCAHAVVTLQPYNDVNFTATHAGEWLVFSVPASAGYVFFIFVCVWATVCACVFVRLPFWQARVAWTQTQVIVPKRRPCGGRETRCRNIVRKLADQTLCELVLLCTQACGSVRPLIFEMAKSLISLDAVGLVGGFRAWRGGGGGARSATFSSSFSVLILATLWWVACVWVSFRLCMMFVYLSYYFFYYYYYLRVIFV